MYVLGSYDITEAALAEEAGPPGDVQAGAARWCRRSGVVVDGVPARLC
jgi:hypothetical protein